MLLFALPTTLASVAICLCIGRAVDRRLEDREIERRAILNLCYFCAYPLTGSTSGICPECGSAVNMSEHGASCQHQRGSYGTS
ncbi:MAG TPA: hypothetical protein VN541_20435 [Tepidisphaeraceae bacterium]|nr:hypothetical protein [Tepidisphaeraceae bacterium]